MKKTLTFILSAFLFSKCCALPILQEDFSWWRVDHYPQVPYPWYEWHPCDDGSFVFTGDYPTFLVRAAPVNLTGCSIRISFMVFGDYFRYAGQGTWNSGPYPASARIVIFTKDAYSNLDSCHTCYWWSAQWAALAEGRYITLTADLSQPWSDGNGQIGTPPAQVAAVGLAFSGGSFFDVGVSGGAGFQLFDFQVIRPTNKTPPILSDY